MFLKPQVKADHTAKMEDSIHKIDNISGLNMMIQTKQALLIWFSHDDCNVCNAVFPKIKKMRDHSFPAIDIAWCDTVKNPEIAAHYSIFTVPALMLYFDGKEYIRAIRNINPSELGHQIQRLYSMAFDK